MGANRTALASATLSEYARTILNENSTKSVRNRTTILQILSQVIFSKIKSNSLSLASQTMERDKGTSVLWFFEIMKI